MAILFADGFEDTSEADYPSTSTSLAAGSGRFGGTALNISSTATYEQWTIPNTSTLFIHFALSPGFLRSGYFLQLLSGSTSYVRLWKSTDGALLVTRDTTTIGQTAPGVIPDSAYTSFQVKVVIHDTTGSVEVRLNGSSTPVLNLTNVDTKNGTNAYVTVVRLNSETTGIGGINVFFDDVVIWDTTGSVNNDWLGELRVDSYMPTADGDTVTLTPSTGTNHYALVDEVPSSATDYNSSSTVGNKDLYQLANMSHTPTTIKAVIAFARLMKDDAGSREMAVIAKSGTTDVEGSSIAIPASNSVRYTHIMETNPDGGGAWSKSAVDALQVGAKVTA